MNKVGCKVMNYTYQWTGTESLYYTISSSKVLLTLRNINMFICFVYCVI